MSCFYTNISVFYAFGFVKKKVRIQKHNLVHDCCDNEPGYMVRFPTETEIRIVNDRKQNPASNVMICTSTRTTPSV